MVVQTSQTVESRKISKNVYTFRNALCDLKSAFNVLILEAISVVTVVILYHAIVNNVSTSLMLHIVFCSIGFALLMTSSIILFAGNNIFGRAINRYHKSIIHGVFIGCGTVLTLTGISIEIDARGTEWPHFSSIHGITGLVAMILMIIAFCVGVLIVLIQHLKNLKKYVPIRPLWWKVLHNTIGLSAYIVGMISICFATQTWWCLAYISEEIRLSIIVVVGLTAFWSCIGVLVTLVDYLKTLFCN